MCLLTDSMSHLYDTIMALEKCVMTHVCEFFTFYTRQKIIGILRILDTQLYPLLRSV